MLRKNELVGVVKDILREYYMPEMACQAISHRIVERILSLIQGDNQRRP